MKQQRMFSPVGAVQSLLIFLLTVLMLVLTILLVIGQNSTMEETLPQADRMVIYASGEQSKYAFGMDTGRVSPYLLAYRQGGGETYVLHASDTVSKPYEVLYPTLRELFGAGGIGYALDADVGTALWSACIGTGDFVYVRYHGALPSSVIRAYTYSEEDSETATAVLDEYAAGNSAYVRELFLVPGEWLLQQESLLSEIAPPDAGEVCAVTCDDRGGVTLFLGGAGRQNTAVQTAAETAEEPRTSDSDAAYAAGTSDGIALASVTAGALDGMIASMAALSAQVQTGTLTFSDAGYGCAVSLDGIYAMPQITRTPYDPAQLYEDPQKLSSVLGLLGLQEGEEDNYYTDGAGDRIYLNASGRLTVSDTASVIRYVALQEGGLDPADYLGYASIGQEYLLSEYLRASDKLLSQLSALEPMFGGDALSCTLTEVELLSEEDADTLVLTWGYTYRGIPLLDENGAILPAMILRAAGGVITELELHLCDAVLAEVEQYLLPQSVMEEAMMLERGTDTEPEASESADDTPETTAPIPLYMAYLCDSADMWGVFSADWIGIDP